MKQKLLLLVITVLSYFAVHAQNRTITGKVTSKDDGIPLPGVSVKLKGSKAGTSTGADGAFSILAPAGPVVLELSSIGYLTRTVNINVSATGTVNISLEPNANELGEIVVTGYGVSIKKRDVTGAVASVSARDIEKVPVVGFDRAIQGKLAGVRVTTTSGTPGAAVNVLIRGVGSFNASTAPLYIIDGIQVNSGDFSRSLSTSNILNTLNPDDIETIDVLKDASSASIYGSQAANGVVVITTKRGKEGKTNFELGSYFGHAEEVNRLKVLDGPQWLTMFLEQVGNRYGYNSATMNAQKAIYGSDPAAAPTYNWYDAIMRKGITQNYQITARGGDAKTKFYVSGSMFDQKGQQINQDFKRYTFKTNLENQINSKLSIETNLSLSSFSQNGTSSGSSFRNPAFAAYFTVPTQPIYNADGSYNEPLLGSLATNAIKSSTYDINRGNTKSLQGNLALNYKIAEGLRFRATGAVDYTGIKEENFWDPRTQDGASYNGLFTTAFTSLTNLQTNYTLNYTKVLGDKHKISALGGFEYRHQKYNAETMIKSNFPNYMFRSINAGATMQQITSVFNEFKTIGYFARAEYSYSDKYIINGTVRYDGNSRFGANDKFGLFASGAFTWRISGESFLKNVKWLSDWKLRTSYGKVGNSGIANFAALALYAANNGYNNAPGISPLSANAFGNPGLTWEDSYTLNLGTDVAFLNNRISLTAEVYNRRNKNLLLALALPSTSGFSSIAANAGELNNKGVELLLNTQNIRGRDFQWTTSFNFARNWNEVKKLLVDDADPRFQLVGNSYTRILSLRYAGVNPADGVNMYYDKNGNLTYQPNTTTDRYIVGDAQQRWYGGLTNTFSYKGLSLDVFFQYAGGHILFDQTSNFAGSYGYISNYTADVLRRWTTPGQVTDVPRAFYGGNIMGTSGLAYSTASTAWFRPADYIRLKEVKLSYTFPAKLSGHIGLSNVRMYAIGTNLLTWTKYTGVDPETTGTTSTSTSDNSVVPQAKTYTIGFQVGF